MKFKNYIAHILLLAFVVMVSPRDWWHDCVHEIKTSTVDKHTHFQKGKETCDFCQLGFHLLSEKPTISHYFLENKVYENPVFSYTSTFSTFLLSTSGRGPPFIS